jgi:hypothetical protein
MKIISVVVNNPIFIEMQYNSLKRFFKSEEAFELIVFNDAKDWQDITNFGDISMKSQITNTCGKLNIKCIDIPNSHHMYQNQPSIRHADSVNFMTKYMFENPDKYLMLDADMFFVDTFDISEFDKYYFCYINQERNVQNRIINYPWPNLFYININEIPNKELIDWSVDYGLDAGGKCANWLSRLNTEKVLKINHLYSCGWNEASLPEPVNKHIKTFLDNDVRNQNNKYFAELYHKKILHYRGGSNWMAQSFMVHNTMIKLLYEILAKINADA